MVRERVQKIIAAAGFCSRRKAEEFIIAGKVTVNGQAITIGDGADAEKDSIMVGKELIQMEKHLYLMLHKPSGFLTTKGDIWGRKDVMSLLPGVQRSVYPIGRLDRDARGLLLLTSDGDFAQKVMHPSNETTKTYQATLDHPFNKEARAAMAEGVKVGSRKVRASIAVIKPKLVELTIHEGRNKIVKRYFNELGYHVNDLKRVGIGNVRLSVPEGKFRELTPKERDMLVEKYIPSKQSAPRKKDGPRTSSFSKDKARKGKIVSDGKEVADKKPFVKRTYNNDNQSERKPYTSRDGERKPFVKRDNKKPFVKRTFDSGDGKPSFARKKDDGVHRPFERKTHIPKRSGSARPRR